MHANAALSLTQNRQSPAKARKVFKISILALWKVRTP
jgi:hypothetical protein